MRIFAKVEKLEEFDVDLFFRINVRMTLLKGEKIIVVLLDGTEIEVLIE